MNRILVVDDNEENLYLLRALLTGHGYEVEEARHGAEALVKARQTPLPRLIISDLLMPVMDGYTLLREWKADERLKQIPFVVYTATYTDPKDEKLALDLGADAFIVKPAEPEPFLARIREVLVKKQAGEFGEPRQPVAEEKVLLKEYSETLIRKLETKTFQLEQANRALVQHITENKQAGEAVRASEARYRRLFESAKDGILILDAETGMVVDVNPFLIQMLGFSHEAFLGKKVYELGFLKDIVANQANFVELQQKEYIRYEDMPLETSDGRLIHVEFVSNVYLVNNQKVIQCNIRDITERKRTEMERERLMTAIEQAAESIFITDPEGTIQYVNPAFERLTGYTKAEAIGQNPRMLKSGAQDAAFYRGLWETISGGGIWKGRMVNKRKDGTLYTEETTISPVCDASGRIINYVAVKRDITRDLERDRQLLQAQKMEAVGQLAGGVAHDFNNILQAIMGYSSMLLEHLPEGEEMHEFAREIAQGADRAAALTRQLLAFSRRQILEMEDLDLNEVIHGLMKMIRRIIGEDIEVKISEGARLGIVHADRGQMEQVLVNLCVNARDAMPGGGVLSIETEDIAMDQDYCTAHAWASPGRYVLLRITDTGCGMDAETQARIFEPFFTTKELGKGTGLGLATVYGIVRQHQGMIQVYSEVGEGTAFKVYLPSFERTVKAVGAKVGERARGGAETILLAEDDQTLRKLASRILKDAGYTVLMAADGREAIEVFERHAGEVDLFLLDVVMPKMGGKAVYDVLHREHPRLRFLFSSGYSTMGIHTDFELKEGFELVQKPYAPNALLRKVREILDKTPEEGSPR